MPIFFLIVGIMLVIVGINNKLKDLSELVKEDFAPSNGTIGFVPWVLAIVIAGAFGYIKDFKPISYAFITLIVIGMLLSNNGFFDKFTSSINQGK